MWSRTRTRSRTRNNSCSLLCDSHGDSHVRLGEGATTYSQPLMCSFSMLFNYLNILKQGGLQGVQLFAAQSLPQRFAGLSYYDQHSHTVTHTASPRFQPFSPQGGG